MYTVTHYQGYDMPTDTELLESYEGEAREIILQSFIDEGMISKSVYTIDETTEDDLEIEVADFLTAEEVARLKEIEKNAPESLWDSLTVESLTAMLNNAYNERRVA